MTVPPSQQCPHEGKTYHPKHYQTINEKVGMVAGYTLQERLGSGSFATVYKGVKIVDTNNRTEIVAIKAIARNSEKITKKVLENLELEISILRTYRHANIVCLKQVNKTERYFYLILEYCAGGDVQHLIRSRKTGRLTERLTRRLMRDLTAGLKFLWGQELIHRDIKPQNLLLTGPLPLDEMHDPAISEAEETSRRQTNFSTDAFHLKIADFGFARHLQTTSLADTLCGSPLYMAPEILQHRRYDAKADLWSVGTVLFEMITGRPPFHGENHIDLLRNIQQKSVRLPKDVKLSGEGVKLLRLLLDRNPISRASFGNFIDASDAFVSLGCNGTLATDFAANDETNISYQHKANLGPISEVEESNNLGVATVENGAVKGSSHLEQQTTQTRPQHINTSLRNDGQQIRRGPPTILSPPSDSNKTLPSPSAISMGQYPSVVVPGHDTSHQYIGVRQYSHFAPLAASPPPPNYLLNSNRNISQPLSMEINDSTSLPQNNGTQIPMKLEDDHQSVHRNLQHQQVHPYRKIDSSQQSDDSGFVMVEHGVARNSASISPATSVKVDDKSTNLHQDQRFSHSPIHVLSRSPPQSTSPRYFKNKLPISTRNLIPPAAFIKKGMLSTSPGTGGALVGMMGSKGGISSENTQAGGLIKSDILAKMLAAAEDVGRRAVNVAHVGDTRAYMAMKLIMSNESDSFLSNTPMHKVEEEKEEASIGAFSFPHETSSAYPSKGVRDVSDRSIIKLKLNAEENLDSNDEMPFAMTSSPKSSNLRMSPGISEPDSCGFLNGKVKTSKNTDYYSLILAHFGEALKCYLKALSMLKGSVNASQRVAKEMKSLSSSPMKQCVTSAHLGNRCEISCTWLTAQFKGVLERADAANTEISKIQTNQLSPEGSDKKEVVSVEELIYNHSLACGRDGAVKQLLGQYDAARSCYRSAGLLAETLMMEDKLGEEDRKVLEEYVQRFSERITEVDSIMLQQSNIDLNSGGVGAVAGLIGRR